MDNKEYELMTIAREFDRKGSFILLKRYYYKNGRKKRNRPLRFQEVISMDSSRSSFLEFIIGVFPQDIKKIPTGFRLKYFSIQAVQLIEAIYPYLDKKKKQAEIILEFSKLKNKRGHRMTQETIDRKLQLFKELQREKAAFAKNKKK